MVKEFKEKNCNCGETFKTQDPDRTKCPACLYQGYQGHQGHQGKVVRRKLDFKDSK